MTDHRNIFLLIIGAIMLGAGLLLPANAVGFLLIIVGGLWVWGGIVLVIYDLVEKVYYG